MTGLDLKALRERIGLFEVQMAEQLAMPVEKYRRAEGAYEVDEILGLRATFIERSKIGGSLEWQQEPIRQIVRIVDAMKKPRGRPRKNQPTEGFTP